MDIMVNGFPVGESEILTYEERAWKKYGRTCRLDIDIQGESATLTYHDPDGNLLSTETIKRIKDKRPQMTIVDDEEISKEDILL